MTVEGLSKDGLHRIQEAWIEHQVPQCGYCQTGIMMMSAAALLASNPKPSDADIDATMTDLCPLRTLKLTRWIHGAAVTPALSAGRKS